MAALSSAQGAENYLMGWPSNQLDEIMWNELGEDDPLEHMAQRIGKDLEFTVTGSPKDNLSAEMSQIYGAVQGHRMQVAGSGNDIQRSEYMGSGAWDSINASDLASVLVTAFPSERTVSAPSSLRLEGSEDEYLVYNEDHYFLQSERMLGSNIDVYITDPAGGDDDDSPALTTSSDLLDTDIRTAGENCKLRLTHRDAEERESSTNCGLRSYVDLDDNTEPRLVGKSGDSTASLPLPSSSLFPFFDSKSSKTRSSYPVNDSMDDRDPVSGKLRFPSSTGGNQYLGINNHGLESGTTTMMNTSGQSYLRSGLREGQMPEFLVREEQSCDGGKSWCSSDKIDDNGNAYDAQSKHSLLLGFPCHEKHRISQAEVIQGRRHTAIHPWGERQTRNHLQELTHLPSKSAEQASMRNIHQGIGEERSSWIESAQCTQPFFQQAPGSISTGTTNHSICSQRLQQSHSIYQQQQLRMQMELATQFHCKRPRTNGHERDRQHCQNVPPGHHHRFQYQMKGGIGMDLNIQKDEDSIEANVLQQLENTIKDITTSKRFVIRDSFYRLAKGARERQLEADGNITGKYGSMISPSLRLSSSGPETETNPFDRWMTNLLFHKRS